MAWSPKTGIANLKFNASSWLAKIGIANLKFEEIIGGPPLYLPLQDVAVWDTNQKTTNTLLSINNTKVDGTNTSNGFVRSNFPLTSKVQWEINVSDSSLTPTLAIGLVSAYQNMISITELGDTEDSVGIRFGESPDSIWQSNVELKTSTIDGDLSSDFTCALRYDSHTGIFEYSLDGTYWELVAQLDTSKNWFPAVQVTNTSSATLNSGQIENVFSESVNYELGIFRTKLLENIIKLSSPILFYKMDDLIGSTIIKDYISTNNGAIFGTPVLKSATILTEAISSVLINDELDYISIPLAILPYGASERTISMWIKRTIGGESGTLFTYGNDMLDQGFEIKINSDGYGFSTYGNEWNLKFDDLEKLTHIALSYHNSSLYFYINGELVHKINKIINTTEEKAFLCRSLEDISEPGLSGIKLGYFAIYNSALSGEEIAAQYAMSHFQGITSYLPVYQEMILAHNPYLYYEFQNIFPAVNDLSGNQNNGTPHGNLKTIDGLNSTSLYSDSRATKGLYVYDEVPTVNIKTIEFWFKNVGSESYINEDFGILDKWINGTTRWAVIKPDNGNFPSLLRGTNTIAISADEDYSLKDVWKHMVVSYNAMDDKTYMYIDTIKQTEEFIGNFFSIANSGTIHIGGYRNSESLPIFNTMFEGAIDSLVIYDSELSTTDISDHYIQGLLHYIPQRTYKEYTLQLQPVRYYPFNINPGETVMPDASGTAYTAELDVPKFNIYKLINGGERVDYATDGGINYGVSRIDFQTTGLPSGNNPVTIEAWCKIDTIYQDGEYRPIAYYGNHSNGRTIGFQVGFDSSNGGEVISFIGCGTAFNYIHPKVWYQELLHLVCTYDGTIRKCYINGELVNTATIALDIGLTNGVIGLNTGGIIDEVAIYNRPLLHSEIMLRYSIGYGEYYDNVSWDHKTQTIPTTVLYNNDMSVKGSELESGIGTFSNIFTEVGLFRNKRYWETKLNSVYGENLPIGIGICRTTDIGDYVGDNSNSISLWHDGIKNIHLRNYPYVPTTDLYLDSVVSLLHFELTDTNNDGSIIADQIISTTWTATGSTEVTEGIALFVSSSCSIQENTDYIFTNSIPILDNIFTIECFYYPLNFTLDNGIFFQGTYGDDDGRFQCISTPSGGISVYINPDNTGTTTTLNAGVGLLILNEWNHIAVCGNGTELSAFINGIFVGSIAWGAKARNVTDQEFYWGYARSSSINRGANGYFSECRITNGALRYTADFTVPVAQYPGGALGPIKQDCNYNDTIRHFLDLDNKQYSIALNGGATYKIADISEDGPWYPVVSIKDNKGSVDAIFNTPYLYSLPIGYLPIQDDWPSYDHRLLSQHNVGLGNSHIDWVNSKILMENYLGGDYDGINILTDIVTLENAFEVSFRRTSAGSWISDDFTDAEFSIDVFFNIPRDEVLFTATQFQYNRPVGTYPDGRITVKFRKTETLYPYINDHLGLTTSDYATDDFNGGNTLSIRYSKNDVTNRFTIGIYSNGTLRQSYLSEDEIIESGTAVFCLHYHNYSLTGSELIEDFTITNNSSLSFTTYQEKAMSLAPVLYWPLKDINILLIKDISGYLRNGYTASTVTHSYQALVDKRGFKLENFGRVILDENPFLVWSTTTTISLWIKPIAFPTTSVEIITTRNSLGDYGFKLSLNNSGILTLTKTPSTGSNLSSASGLVLEMWNHVVIKEVGGIWYIYINSKLSSQANARVYTGSVIEYLTLGPDPILSDPINIGVSDLTIYDKDINLVDIEKLFNAGVGALNGYQREVCLTKPVAYWRFDDEDLTLAKDMSQWISSDGNYDGDITLGEPLIYNGLASYFDGINSSVTIPHTSKLVKPNNFTIMLLIQSTGTTGKQPLFCWGNPNVSPYGFFFEYDADLRNINLVYYDSGWITQSFPEYQFVYGETYHITIKGGTLSGNTIEIIINTEEIGFITLANTIVGSTDDKLIGTNTVDYWEGIIDEVSLWDYQLTPLEVFTIYDNVFIDTFPELLMVHQPLGYWRLDEASGSPSTVYDSSGNNRNLSTYVVSGSVAITKGVVGQNTTAYRFPNGAQTALQYTHGSKLLYSSNYTMGVWCKRDGSVVSGQAALIGNYPYITLVLYNGGISVYNHKGTTANPVGFKYPNNVLTTIPNDGNWHFVVIAGSASTGSVKAYLDGAYLGSLYAKPASTTFRGFSLMSIRTGSNTASISWINHKLYIDDAFILNKILTDEEVLDLYNIKDYYAPALEDNSFTLPYNLDKIDTLSHNFTLPYDIDRTIGIVDYDFTLPYLLEYTPEILILTDFDFTLPFDIYFGVASEFQSPLVINFLTALTGTSRVAFSLPYLYERIDVSEFAFQLPYFIKLDLTAYEFDLPYYTNVIPKNAKSVFNLSYKYDLTQEETHTFNTKYRLSFLSVKIKTIPFVAKYKIFKSKVTNKGFKFPFRLDLSDISEKVFSLPYRNRLLPEVIQTDFNFIDNNDGTYNFATEIDMSDLKTGLYNIVVDNGSRFLRYVIPSNPGNNITNNNIIVQYDYTLNIPVLDSPNPETEVNASNIKYYDGTFGWNNIESNLDFSDTESQMGTLVVSGTWNTLLGMKPYALDNRITVIITSLTEGYHIFDFTSEDYNGALFIVNSLTNRVIGISKLYSDDEANDNRFKHRLTVRLPEGEYYLAPRTLLDDVSAPTSLFHIYGYGPKYGYNDIEDYITHYGSAPFDEIPDDDVDFSVESIYVELKNIDIDSSLSFSLYYEDFTPLGVKWNSLIPKYEIGLETEKDWIIMGSNLLRLKTKTADECCFGRKLSLDEFDILCRIPTPKSVPKIKRNKISITNTMYVFGLHYNIEKVD